MNMNEISGFPIRRLWLLDQWSKGYAARQWNRWIKKQFKADVWRDSICLGTMKIGEKQGLKLSSLMKSLGNSLLSRIPLKFGYF